MKQSEAFEKIQLQSEYKIAIVVSDYYQEISNQLLAGSRFILDHYPNIQTKTFKVSGSFELPIVCQSLLQQGAFDGAIALGVVIQGETRHFDFVSQGVTDGLMRVMLDLNKPIGFGVLTVQSLEQAQKRAEAISHSTTSAVSNKGIETAVSVIKALKAIESIQS